MSVYGYRRGSIFWALALIAVGVLFLYNNFNPAVRPWHIIAKWWPILIIFWGLSKLIDYVHARAHPEAVPPPLFSASEVILLILILILGSLVSKIVLRPWHEWPAAVGIQIDEDFADLFLEPHTYTETLTLPVKAPGGLLVVNRRGDVEIHGADQNNIEAVVKKTIRAPNEAEAKKLSDQLKVELVEQAGRYLVQTNLDSLPSEARHMELAMVLRVPKGTAAEISVDRGDITVEGLTGNQTINSKRGDVRVTNVEGLVRVRQSRGDATVREVKGSVEVEGRGSDVEVAGVTGTVVVNGDFSGTVQFNNVAQSARYVSSRTNLSVQKLSGRVYMELGSLDASGIDGPFEVATRQKDIRLAEFKHSVKVENTNGEVWLSTSAPPSQPVTVDLRRGGIQLILPANANFQIDATSRHGEVECDFVGPGLNVRQEGETPSITGTVGKGGPTIRLATTYGTIRLTREGAGARDTRRRDTHPGPHPPPPPAVPATPAAPASTRQTAADHHEAHRPAADRECRILVEASWQRAFVRLVRRVNPQLVHEMCRAALKGMVSVGRDGWKIASLTAQ